MENVFTCPVCNKTGIPDFRNENVVCPCCGTDLSVYRTINAVQEATILHGGKNKKAWILAAFSSVVAVASLITCVYFYTKPPVNEPSNDNLIAQIDSLKQENKSLSDSISVLNEKSTSRRTYTVVKGDCPWRISEKVFGDGRRYDELLRLNNMSTANDFNKIKVGEILYIE